MGNYQILLLDADDTLLDFKRSEAAALSLTFEQMGWVLPEDGWTCFHQINDELWKAYEQHLIKKEALVISRFEKLMATYGFTGDAKIVNETYYQAMQQQGFLLNGALSFLNEVKQDFRLYCLSNGTPAVQYSKLEKAGIRNYFDGIFLSDEVGAPKPDSLFFERVFVQIPNFSKEKSLMIGDSLTSDIIGGIQAGIDTCWFNPQRLSLSEGLSPTYEVHGFKELLKVVRDSSNFMKNKVQ